MLLPKSTSAHRDALPQRLPPPEKALPKYPLPEQTQNAKRTEALLESGRGGNTIDVGQSNTVSALKQKLAQLQASAYAADPMLKRCEDYEERLEDWLSRTGAQSIENGFITSTSDPELRKKRSAAVRKLNNLLSPILMKEFASNPSLAELANWMLALHHAQEPRVLFLGVDPILGIKSSAPLSPLPNASPSDQMMAEIDARYDRIVREIDRIATEIAMPSPVMEAVRDQHIYRMLTDISRTYVLVKTPPEIRALKAQLEQAQVQENIKDSR